MTSSQLELHSPDAPPVRASRPASPPPASPLLAVPRAAASDDAADPFVSDRLPFDPPPRLRAVRADRGGAETLVVQRWPVARYGHTALSVLAQQVTRYAQQYGGCAARIDGDVVTFHVPADADARAHARRENGHV